MAKPLMIQGTMSNVGKSLITAGLCRIFMQDGYRVAPFKSQNMALNSFITPEGLEMGNAQALQAEAAGIPASALMNPVLLKPTSNKGSEIILKGVSQGFMDASTYCESKKKIRFAVEEAYHTLAAQYDIMVIEGAGSPAEINLNKDDFANMGMADIADAPVLLVADIDRGGALASIYGTVMLLEEAWRKRFKGLIINKFRGDPRLFTDGLHTIEELCGVPAMGIVPYLELDIDDEDRVIERKDARDARKLLDVVVIRLPRATNTTDFSTLASMDVVGLRYECNADQLGNPDVIIIPSSQSPMADLQWMRERGLEHALQTLARKGTPLMGIGSGYEMLGETISDPHHKESGGTLKGMGLLPVKTVVKQKDEYETFSGTTEEVKGFFSSLSQVNFSGYRMRTNVISENEESESHALFAEGVSGGSVQNKIVGTSLQGFLEGEACEVLVRLLLAHKGITNVPLLVRNKKQDLQGQFDLLAQHLRENLDMPAIYRILEGKKQ